MKKYLKYFLVLAVLGVGFGFYMYNKPHENMQRAKADVQIGAVELFTAYEADDKAGNEKFLGKILEVSGEVSDVTKDETTGLVSVTLDGGGMMFGVRCQMDALTEHSRTDFTVGEKIILKGKCTGMLSDVILNRCVEPQS